MDFPSIPSSFRDWAEAEQRIKYGDDQIFFEVQKGDDLGNRMFAYADENALHFAITPDKLKITGKHPKPQCTNFFLLDSVGVDRPQEVYLVMSGFGDAAAAKFYPFKPSRKSTKEERQEQNEKTVGLLEHARDHEWELWNLLYPGRARAIRLRGLPCLLMPYGCRILVVERTGVLRKIEDKLKQFYDNGYVYEGIDFPWHHVLLDQKGDLFLGNLGSLVEVQESKNKESKKEKGKKKALAIQTQMDIFKEGLEEECKEDLQEDSDSQKNKSGSKSSEIGDGKSGSEESTGMEEAEDGKPAAARTRQGENQAESGSWGS